jgi:hypothetical protein
MRLIAFAAVLVCGLTACSDRPSPVEPGSAAAPTAVAATQGRPTDAGQTFTAGPGELCGFPVFVELSGKAKTIELPGGRTIMTAPGLTVTLTNLDNENQERLNITGAFHQRTLENGNVETVSTGRSALFAPIVPGLVLVIGRFSFVLDEEGELFQPLQGTGQQIDVCELLA